MSEQEIPVENEENEEGEDSSLTTKTDNVENPETRLRFDHLMKNKTNVKSKHPYIKDTGKKPIQVRKSFSSFLKNPARSS